jgi:Na+-driven multidrug efflux pump
MENNPKVIDRTEALGKASIKRLLFEYAGPAIVAMTASSLYNMVDSIFIGHGVGPLAISGLALTFPVMNLSAAFGAMVGVGASTLLSVKLGEGDKDTAKRCFRECNKSERSAWLCFYGYNALLLRPYTLFLWS